MSTVAWDGKTLAADRQSTNADMARSVSKMRRTASGEILAMTGEFGLGLLLFDWYENGADLAQYPEFQKDKDDWCRLIVLKLDGTIQEYERRPVAMSFAPGLIAWGSGRDYAIGALAMGATAEQAVEVASRFDVSTGLGVESFTL